MRLLVLCHFCPLPANNGSKLRTWAILRALAAEGHELTLLMFAEPQEIKGHDAELRKVCHEVRCLPWTLPSLSSGRQATARLRSVLSPLPYGVIRFESAAIKRHVSDILAEDRFDAIICEEPYLLINLPEALPTTLVIDSQNVEHVVLERYLAHESNSFRRLYAWLEAHKLKTWEKQTWSRANLVTACSAQDKRLMNRLCPDLPVAVIPNVVDTDSYVPVAGDDDKTILYAGGMDWYPNRDAVEYFITDILPHVRSSFPDVRFEIAGRNASDEFQGKFEKVSGVHFTGTVPDMRPEIAKAAVSVVPLRIGSGTRLKILEAAAMAKPIVSTRVGAEGLDFVDGEEIILADEPKPFAQAVADLLTDPSRRRKLGQAARRRVVLQYGLPALRAALRNGLGKLDGHPARPIPAGAVRA